MTAPAARNTDTMLALQRGAGNAAATVWVQRQRRDAVLAHDPDAGVSTLEPQSADAGEATSRLEDPVSSVLAALQGAPSPVGGYSPPDFSAAFRIINGLPTSDLLPTLLQLDRRGVLEPLLSNAGQAQLVDDRVLTMMAAVEQTRLSRPDTPREKLDKQLTSIEHAQEKVDEVGTRLLELTGMITATPEKFALAEAEGLTEPLHQFIAQLEAVRSGLMPELQDAADGAGRLETMVVNVRSLEPVVQTAVRTMRTYHSSTLPDETYGETYEGEEDRWRHERSADWDRGGFVGSAEALWDELNLEALNLFDTAGGMATLGHQGREARNAAAYRAGKISYETYSSNVKWDIGATLVSAVVVALTAGLGAEVAGGMGLAEGTFASGAVQGAVVGPGAAVARDIYEATVAAVSDVPGVQQYHGQMIGGPMAWMQSAMMGGLFGGVFTWGASRLSAGVPELPASARPETPGGGAPAGAGADPPTPRFDFRVSPSADPGSGLVTAIGRNLDTGEFVIVQIDPASGSGSATFLATQETVPIVGWNVQPAPAGLLEAGPPATQTSLVTTPAEDAAAAVTADPVVGRLMELPGVQGDLGRLTGRNYLTGNVTPQQVVADLDAALWQIERVTGDPPLTEAVLSLPGIEDYFKEALTTANPHTVDYELIGVIDQLRAHPNATFRYQIDLGGRKGPDLGRFEGGRASIVQFKSYRSVSDLKANVFGDVSTGSLGTGKEAGQLQSDLERLARQNPPYTVPGPDGAPVPVNELLEYEFDLDRLEDPTYEKVDALEEDLQFELNRRLSDYRAADPTMPAFRVRVKVR
jgi:hypothetical protein